MAKWGWGEMGKSGETEGDGDEVLGTGMRR